MSGSVVSGSMVFPLRLVRCWLADVPLCSDTLPIGQWYRPFDKTGAGYSWTTLLMDTGHLWSASASSEDGVRIAVGQLPETRKDFAPENRHFVGAKCLLLSLAHMWTGLSVALLLNSHKRPASKEIKNLSIYRIKIEWLRNLLQHFPPQSTFLLF